MGVGAGLEGPYPNPSRIGCGRATDALAEIADEMRLIEVSEVHRQLRVIDRKTLVEPLERFW